ncbi:ATP-dependent DNA helicase, partial [Pseudomonas corrugata]|nr:ATP-dependent DNA helicase [Pseudomonas corrugata]
LDQAALREIALAHEVCPYYLSQEMARWADVVVADYNYYFDFSALLFALAQADGLSVATLVDEAHNLVERGRQMYSATLDQSTLAAVRKTAPEALKKALQRVNRQWNALHAPQVAAYQAYEKPPEKLLQALSQCTTAVGDYLNDHPQGLDGDLQAFYFEALQFGRVAESFSEHFLFDIHKRELGRQRSLSTLCLRNVVPAGFLRPRLTAARSSVLFSAT